MQARPSRVVWRSPSGAEVLFQKGNTAAFNYDGKFRTGIVTAFYCGGGVVRGLVLLGEDGGRPKRFAFDRMDLNTVE